MRTGVRAAILFFALQAAIVHAQAPAERWTFSVMPYLWLPTMDGTLRYGSAANGGAAPVVAIDAGTILSDLNMAFMISGEARKGRWLIATDYIYLDLGGDHSSVKSIDFNPGSGPVNVANTALDSGTQTTVKGTVWTLAGGYAAVQDPGATLDVIGGVRYLGVKAKTDWQLTATVSGPGGSQAFPAAGSVSQSEDLWDAIIGIKGRFKLGQGNWFIPYYLDAGVGDSSNTWQSMFGVGHAFKWGEVTFAYRYLSWRQGGNKLVEDFTVAGFGLGVNFRF